MAYHSTDKELSRRIREQNNAFSAIIDNWNSNHPKEKWVVVSDERTGILHIEEANFSKVISGALLTDIASMASGKDWKWELQQTKFGLLISFN